MYTGMLHTHKLVVTLFLLIYLIKTILLLLNKKDALNNFSRKTKVVEMIVSFLFLATGIYLASNSGNTGTWLWVKIAAIALSIPIAVVGFKGQKKGLALISLLLIVYAYGVSETKSPVFKKVKKESDTVAAGLIDGKEIYTQHCISCHGDNGKLGLSGAKDLSVSTLSHEEKITIINQGKNAMMGFENDLNPEQIAAVADYIETLK